jgi:hypothetical protein
MSDSEKLTPEKRDEYLAHYGADNLAKLERSFAGRARDGDECRCPDCSLDAFDDHVRPHLPRVPIGARVRFLRADLDAWLAARREAPSAVQQNRPSASEAASGTTASPSLDGVSLARQVSQLADELRVSSQLAGTRRTRRHGSRLRLVQR